MTFTNCTECHHAHSFLSLLRSTKMSMLSHLLYYFFFFLFLSWGWGGGVIRMEKEREEGDGEDYFPVVFFLGSFFERLSEEFSEVWPVVFFFFFSSSSTTGLAEAPFPGSTWRSLSDVFPFFSSSFDASSLLFRRSEIHPPEGCLKKWYIIFVPSAMAAITTGTYLNGQGILSLFFSPEKQKNNDYTRNTLRASLQRKESHRKSYYYYFFFFFKKIWK